MRDIENYQQAYLDNPFEEELVRFRHRKTLETITELKPGSILEVGCGLVPLYTYCESFDRLTIVEPSRLFAERASECAPEGVVVINKPLSDDLTQEKFELIVLSSLLHELEAPGELLAVAKRYATPDSIFHINVPNARSMHRQLALRMGLIDTLEQKSDRQVRFQQSHTFTVETLSALVRSVGLEVDSIETFFIKPFTHAQMQSLIDDGVLNEQMLEGLYGLSRDLPDAGAEIVLNARLAT